METGQDDKEGPKGAGTRIIGQMAGHEINLEIEDVLDKKKYRVGVNTCLMLISISSAVFPNQGSMRSRATKKRMNIKLLYLQVS